MARIVMEVDDKELWSCIMGSGWESWEWWQWLDYTEGDWETPGECWVVVEDPWTDDSSMHSTESFSAKVTMADLERALSELTQHHGVMECIGNEFDFDSVYGDCVIQQAVLGEQIYG